MLPYGRLQGPYFWTDVDLAVQAIRDVDPFITPTPLQSPDLCYSGEESLAFLTPVYNYPVEKESCKDALAKTTVEMPHIANERQTAAAEAKYGPTADLERCESV